MLKVQEIGCSESFSRLYDRHSSVAFRAAQSVCRNKVDAEEAVQEGFLSIWRSRETYRPRPTSSFRGWVIQVVRNRAIDITRRQAVSRRCSPVGDGIEALPLTSPAALEQVAKESKSQALRASISELPDDQSEAIFLAYFAQMTHTEIAEHLDLPPGTVKGRIRLGMEKLWREMEFDLSERAEVGVPW